MRNAGCVLGEVYSSICMRDAVSYWQNPHGGGMSTTTFSLDVLYDQYKRFRNTSSYPSDQLDLARYKGCKFSFYRHHLIIQ